MYQINRKDKFYLNILIKQTTNVADHIDGQIKIIRSIKIKQLKYAIFSKI